MTAIPSACRLCATCTRYRREGGTKDFGFTARASHSDLHEYLRLVKGLKREHYEDTEHCFQHE